jgi:hypothetical protein
MEVNLFSSCDIRVKQSFSSLLCSYLSNNYSIRRIFTVKTNFKQILNNEICSKFGFEFTYVALYSDQRYWISHGRNTYLLYQAQEPVGGYIVEKPAETLGIASAS